MPPFGDLAEEFGQAENQLGKSYWVVVRSVAAFCLCTRLATGHAEGGLRISETALVRHVIAQDTSPESIYVGDRGFGVCRVVRTASHYGHPAVLRLGAKTAKRMLRETVGRTEIPDHSEVPVIRSAGPKTKAGFRKICHG